MTVVKSNLLKATCLSLATLGATSFVITMAVPDYAYAKGAKKGKKPSKSNRGKSGNSRGSNGNGQRGNVAAQELGVHPSDLGALNAANANWHALENASPDSRVGKIAIYRDAVLAGQQIDADLAAVQEILALGAPARTSSEIYDQAVTDGIIIEGEDLTGDPEYDAALAYEKALIDEALLIQQQLDQPELETSLLEDAANKDVTPEVEAAVQELLGLTEDPAPEVPEETAPEEPTEG